MRFCMWICLQLYNVCICYIYSRILRVAWCPPKPLYATQNKPQHQELYALLFANSMWVFLLHGVMNIEGLWPGPKVYRPYPRRLKSLTICRRPWVLVRPEFWTRDLPQSSPRFNQLSQTVNDSFDDVILWLCFAILILPRDPPDINFRIVRFCFYPHNLHRHLEQGNNMIAIWKPFSQIWAQIKSAFFLQEISNFEIVQFKGHFFLNFKITSWMIITYSLL